MKFSFLKGKFPFIKGKFPFYRKTKEKSGAHHKKIKKILKNKNISIKQEISVNLEIVISVI